MDKEKKLCYTITKEEKRGRPTYRIFGGTGLDTSQFKKILKLLGTFLKRLLPLTAAYFLVELLAFLLLEPGETAPLAFGLCWGMLLAALCLVLPRLAGRIFFGITYYVILLWTLAQIAYDSVFDRMMWLTDMFYAGEGADYLTDILSAFPVFWWIGGFLLLGLGAVLIWRFPKTCPKRWIILTAVAVPVIVLCFLPELVFLRDLDVWGTRSEYGQSSSYRATYHTMYDARNVYDICGVYQLTFRDTWKHLIYPLTPAYRSELAEQTKQLDEYFTARGVHADNEMTGVFADKNVVLVLMESMDDWMITQEDTPTLYRLMAEGINFTQFYTPGYGTARTINSEFCVNTGIYLPTNGKYVFNYVTNDFSQSFAAQATDNGYSTQVFHYNTPEFYSRGVFEVAMGYEAYNCYADYVSEKDRLYDDSVLFDIPQLNELFFREGKTLNTIITRSAHLSYTYNEVLSNYALKQYPQYRGKYASQEEDCARVKAKLVDDMFARLLTELEKKGQLENTVIIGVTDHYTYGYKNTEELYALSGTDQDLLLEKTPCFVWASDGPAIRVDKTLNTSDFLPTMLNLLGYDSPYSYLGQDAFDPGYEGYALFPDGSWICRGVVCRVGTGGKSEILHNSEEIVITDDWLDEMSRLTQEYIRMSNLLLTSNYYQNIQ